MPGPLSIVGAGMSRTGTTTLHLALTSLGFRCIHFDDVRMKAILDGSDTAPTFRIYDDVDAVVDLPAAAFFEELLDVYPDAKCILTVRDEDDWWHSISTYLETQPLPDEGGDSFLALLHKFEFGSVRPKEFLYRRRYREHNERVRLTVAPDRLLVMDIATGDGWAALCPFLGIPEPRCRFRTATG